MFTGIVEEMGSVAALDGGRLRLSCRKVLEDVELGASIAVNGCCLTVVAWDTGAGWFDVDVTPESFARTQLGYRFFDTTLPAFVHELGRLAAATGRLADAVGRLAGSVEQVAGRPPPAPGGRL